MRKNVWVLGIIACMLITACGSSKQEPLKDEYGSLNESENIYESTNGEAISDTGIPKEFVIEAENGNGTVKLNCKTDITSIENVAIYDVNEEVIDEKYITELAEKIFDGGKYEVLNPYGTMSNDEIDKISKAYLDSGVYGANSGLTVIPLSYYKMYDSAAMEPESVIVKTNSFGGAEECRLRGKMSGKEYELVYVNVSGAMSISIYQTSTEHKYLDSSRYLDGILNVDAPLVSKEDADKQVQDFVNKLGYKDFELSSVCSRWCDRGDDKAETFGDCGYVYTYKRNIGGVTATEYIKSSIMVLDDMAIGGMTFDSSFVEELEAHGLSLEDLEAGGVQEEGKISGPTAVDELVEDGFSYNDNTVIVTQNGTANHFGDAEAPIVLWDAEKIQIELDDTGILNVLINTFDNPVPRKEDNLKVLNFSQCVDAAKEGIGCYEDLVCNAEGKALNNIDVYVRLTYQRIIRKDGKAYMPILVFEISDDEISKHNNMIPKDCLFGVNVVDGSIVKFYNPGRYQRYRLEE